MSPSEPTQAALTGLIADARVRLRAPRAAAIAGFLFSALFLTALALLRGAAVFHETDAGIERWFAAGGEGAVIVASLYLLPFAAVMFLWFIAVIRDQIGDREDQFFATVFFGSGLLFVALVTLTAITSGAVVVGVRYLDQPPPTAQTVRLLTTLAYTVLFGMGTRAAALFMFATATVGLRSGTFPRWFAAVGYVVGAVLLLVVAFVEWVILVFPIWVVFVSGFILARRRSDP